jgi:hypothetical protein
MNDVFETYLCSVETDHYYDQIEQLERADFGPAHNHPGSEYIVVEEGFIILEYIKKGKLEQLISRSAVIVSGNTPHRLYLNGKAKVFTTEDNLKENNLDIRKELSDFIPS